MTADHAAQIAAAEATLAAAQADVDRLRAALAAEHAASTAEQPAPRLATWNDGIEAARKRHPHLRKAADEAAAASREAARPKPPSELNGPIAMTPAARYLMENGPEPHTATGRAAARFARPADNGNVHPPVRAGA
jgi:hypothetical protein